jgi:hypothetical protein
MIKHRGSVSENQLLSIFRRINKKADACITFQEFVSFVCTSQMNHEKLLKKMSLVVLESRESAKKPLISPVVRHLENERRSKSPLLKEISMLSAKNIHKDFKNYSKGRISPVRASDNKSRGASPHSRSPVRPTPTLSARRENLVKSIKISQSHQVKSPGRQTTDKSHLDRRQLFKSEVEKLKIHPTHKQDAKKRTSPSPDYHSMRKGGYTPVLGTDKSASKKDLTVSTYLEQRRAEFKTQRSDSKPKTDQEFSPTRFHEREELENKGIHTEPTTKQVSRSLKYEETRPSDQVKPLKGRIIDPAFTSSGIENKAESHLSLEKGHVSKDSHKQSVVKGTSNLGSQREHARKRENDGSQTLIDSLTSIPETSSRVFQQPASNLKASDRQHPHLVQHVPAAVIQLTPTKLSDSLEADHSSTTQRRIALREKYSKSPIMTEAKRVESSHLVSGYHTGQSELSFSDRKTDELMAETPKFDSGIHQADTGARPSRHHLHASEVNFKTSDFEKLCTILKKIIVFYERIEEIKNQIHNEKDFSLAHHFSSFDFENKGYLTLNEFVQLFNSFGINIGRGEIVEYLKLILKKASIRPESRLTEADLAKCFAPLNAEGKLLLYSSTNSRQEGAGKYEVKPHLSAKLDEIVQLQIKLHCELIKEIKPIDPSMLPKLFKVLSENKAVASCEQITQFLKLNDVKFFENDVIFIFREFNCRQPKELHENEFLAFFRLYATAGL